MCKKSSSMFDGYNGRQVSIDKEVTRMGIPYSLEYVKLMGDPVNSTNRSVVVGGPAATVRLAVSSFSPTAP